MKSKRKKPSVFSKTVLLLNYAAIFLLLLSYTSPYINPEKLWPVAFLGLAYPFILIFNIGFVLYWIFRLRYYFLLSLITILLGYNQFGNFFQVKRNISELPENETTLKILTYNVRVFDLYNYGPNWEHRFENRNNIFKFLKTKDFDIIFFQEFVHDKSESFKTQDTLQTFLRANNLHSEFTRSSRNINFFGLATYSAYPIINKGKILFETHGGNLCIYTDVLVGNDTIRLYNVHLESIGLSHEDHIFVENMVNIITPDNKEIRISGRRILSRLKVAFQRRAPQAIKVAEHISQSPYPVILGADFNDTPSSFVYKQFTNLLQDSFKNRGLGIGQTYIGIIPGFRIDYIMHSSEFETLQYFTGKQSYSDHYPVYVFLKFSNN